MNYTHCTIATVAFLYLRTNPNQRNLPISQNFNLALQAKQPYRITENRKKLSFRIRASASDNGGAVKWVNYLPTGAFAADKILRLIAGASSPICQYMSSPSMFLHSIDPIIKLLNGHQILRCDGVVLLAHLLSLILWVFFCHQLLYDQLGRVSLISGILFIMLGLGADGVPSLRLFYSILKLGPLQFTRKGLSVASTVAFKQLASALRWFMLPLASIGVPVVDIILTLMLSLRLVSLVFDEYVNVAMVTVQKNITNVITDVGEIFDGERRIYSSSYHAFHVSLTSHLQISVKMTYLFSFFFSLFDFTWIFCLISDQL
ncbi:hypothetical protein UlMin_028685 [Ulmus minor]